MPLSTKLNKDAAGTNFSQRVFVEAGGEVQIVAQIAKVDGVVVDPATEATSAAILAKIIAAPATAAKQPALGTAGTPSSDVITIQGAAAMTALKVDAASATSLSDSNRVAVDDRDGLIVSGSATSAVVLFSQNMLGYSSITVQVTSAGSGNVLQFESSDDNANWTNSPGLLVGAVGTTSSVYTATAGLGNMYQFTRRGLYFRVRVLTYGSGTVSVTATLSKVAVVNVLSTVGITGGPVAHDGVVSGNPVRVGARAVTANYTAVASGDVADLVATLVGAIIQKPYSIPEADWSYAAAAGGILNSATAVTIAAAAAAGLRNYITAFDISSEALGTATEFAIRDGAGGAVLWRIKIGTAGLPLTSLVLPSPLKSTAATLLEVVTLTASTTGAVYVNFRGYVAP